MTGRRMKEIQIIADGFRDCCRIIKYSISDIFSECDRAGFRLIRYPIGPDGVLGFAQIRDGDKIVFSNSSLRLSREIFSVAHEIGHICLHVNEERNMFVDNDFIDSDEFETEANYFAACLLMPEDMVSKYISFEMSDKPFEKWTALDIAKLMTAFNVSFDMAINRLENLRKIRPTTRSRLITEKNQSKVCNLLRMIGGNSKLNSITNEKKIPSDYMEWVVDNYNRGIIPKETLQKSLGYFDLSIDDISDEIRPKQMDDGESWDDLIGGMDD